VILIVEDDRGTAEDLRRFLAGNFECRIARSVSEAAAAATQGEIAAALVDLHLSGGESGFDVIRELRRIDPRTAILVVTGDETEEALERAGELGVEDYLRKSSGSEALRRAIRQALVLRRVRYRVERAEAPGTEDGILVAESTAMKATLDEARRAALHTLPVLISGGVGAGKYAVARFIHEHSRLGRPFEVLHCGTLDTSVVDDQLFGHEPGAFTGATARALGGFERTEDGTLVLDDVDCLPPEKQAKLLEPLERKMLRRLGGTREIAVRCRVIATSNKNLDALVAKGLLLPDLLDRLRGATPVRVPDLSERAADVPGLVRRFAAAAARENGVRECVVTTEFLRSVSARAWKSVRHLRNAVAYAVAVSGGGPLGPDSLPAVTATGVSEGSSDGTDAKGIFQGSLQEILDRTRAAAVQRALDAAGGDKRAAAVSLGITPQGLNRIIRETGSEPR
jgi:DNA-binding NtrC family response regulator